MVGSSNAAAVGWIDRWPEWPAPAFILSGPAASGKSHLAAVWQTRSNATTVPAEMLISRSAEDIASVAKTLLIDGADPWIGTREAEETLFHLYNIFKEEQRSMLLTMRSTPSQLDFTIPDLASRVRAAPGTTIMSPCETLLQNIIVKMFADRQIDIGEDVLKYILPRMERSFAAAKDIVTRADAAALSQKRPVTVPLIRDILIDL